MPGGPVGPSWGAEGAPAPGPALPLPQGPWAQHGPRRLRSPAGPHGPSAHRPDPPSQRCAFPTGWRGRQLQCGRGDSPTKPKSYTVKRTKRSNPTLAPAKPSAALGPFWKESPATQGPCLLPRVRRGTATPCLTPPPPTNCGSKAPRGARDPLRLVPVTPANWSARRPAKPRLLAGPGHSLPRAPASHSVRSLPPPSAPPQHWEPSPTDPEHTSPSPLSRSPLNCKVQEDPCSALNPSTALSPEQDAVCACPRGQPCAGEVLTREVLWDQRSRPGPTPAAQATWPH